MKYFLLLGRILFSIIFLMAPISHFSQAGIDYAATKGVPMSSFLVPLSGVIAMLGGLSILLGVKAKWGGWLIVFFLLPVTLMMHNFWTVQDHMQMQMQMGMFMKNLALLGGALVITYFGSGPLSVDGMR